MEKEDARLKFFFDELYLSSNPSSNNKGSQEHSTGASNTSIDTIANLEVNTTSRTITRHKTSALVEHTKIIDFELTKYTNEALMPNTTTTSTATHLEMILINPITTQNAILNISHNQRWEFRIVNDDIKIEELTVHSYDVRLHIQCVKKVFGQDLHDENQLSNSS
ncbi:6174_t:CDS:2, partial [Diversispora eburnea]